MEVNSKYQKNGHSKEPWLENQLDAYEQMLPNLRKHHSGYPDANPLRRVASICHADDRLRLIVETDAGGDPDDEQSLVRLLVYASEFDIEGIIANRPAARDKENRNPVRDGLGSVRAMVNAYGQCRPNLIKHDPHFPETERLLARTVAGYDVPRRPRE